VIEVGKETGQWRHKGIGGKRRIIRKKPPRRRRFLFENLLASPDI
jgi:hypothetical protein